QFVSTHFFFTAILTLYIPTLFPYTTLFRSGVALILFIVSWILGIVRTIIKYGNFTITKDDGELLITRGLLEKRQLTIPLRRIQAIGMKESMIRQPLGYITVFAEVAGSTSEQ